MRQIKNKNFLLVDDELEEYAATLKRGLTRFGITAEVAFDYYQALERIQKTKFGLAVIDINLGDYKPDGLELVKKIRETDSDMVIYVLTGYGRSQEQAALKAGADQFYQKPFAIKEHVLKPMGVIHD